jgi:hypothetical protein
MRLLSREGRAWRIGIDMESHRGLFAHDLVRRQVAVAT